MPEAKLMLSLLGVVYKLLPNKYGRLSAGLYVIVARSLTHSITQSLVRYRTKSMLVRDSASWMIGAQVRVEDMERCFLRAGANYEAWDQIKVLGECRHARR